LNHSVVKSQWALPLPSPLSELMSFEKKNCFLQNQGDALGRTLTSLDHCATS
jgi:hypothetical protein